MSLNIKFEETKEPVEILTDVGLNASAGQYVVTPISLKQEQETEIKKKSWFLFDEFDKTAQIVLILQYCNLGFLPLFTETTGLFYS